MLRKLMSFLRSLFAKPSPEPTWGDEVCGWKPDAIVPDFDAGRVASRLSKSQRITIWNLSEDYEPLGCSEPVAERLTKANTRRPALVQMRQGAEWKEFALTPEGLAVRAKLTDLA